MVNLAMHLMDIVQNSISAGAKRIEMELIEISANNCLQFSVIDDGCGMSSKTIARLTDPFFTSRTTRKVGLGIPFLKMTSEQTDGYLEIKSEIGKRTIVKAVYKTNHPDCIPLGDLGGYMMVILAANPIIHFSFSYRLDDNVFEIDTNTLANEGIDDLSNGEIALAIKEYINENLKILFEKRDKSSFLN